MGFEHHRDQRKSYRCAAAEPRRNCDFKAGDNTRPAKLLDESAGGFSVLIPHQLDIDLTIDQTAQVRTNAGWSNVRIVHIQKILPPKKAVAEAEAEMMDMGPGPWLRLGLRRLGDAKAPDQPAISLLAGSLSCRLGQWRSSSMMPMLSLGLFVAVVTVVAPLVMMQAGWGIGLTITNQIQHSNERKADSATTRTSPAGTSKTSAVHSVDSGTRHQNNAVFQPNGGRSQDASLSSPSKPEQRNSMLQLPGASPFLLPEVVARLQLTSDQQKQIEQIIEAASEAIRKLAEQFQGMQRQEISQRRQELLDQARRNALELLTEQQRAEWEKLSGGQ